MNRNELIEGLKTLNAPNQGMNYHAGGIRRTSRMYDETTGERLPSRIEAASLTVCGDRARFLYRLIEHSATLAEDIAALPAAPTPADRDAIIAKGEGRE